MNVVASRSGGSTIGRANERGWVDARQRPGARIAITGEPGIGKSTIWAHAVERARERGSPLLVASPTAAEASLSYAVLADLLEALPVTVLDALPAPQRRAIDGVLLLSDGFGDDLRSVATAVRTALALLAEGAAAPAVIAIDDAQWIDASSAAVLVHVLRRADDVGTICAWRRGAHVPLGLFGDSELLELGPLAPRELFDLVRSRLGLTLRPVGLARLHEVSEGNPFYALELATTIRDGGLERPNSLEALTIARVRALPRRTRLALGAAALAGTALPRAAVGPARRAGIIEDSAPGDRPRFSHPLLAEAVIATLEPAERRAIHRAAGGAATDGERRAHHLALGAERPDASLAAGAAEAALAAESAGRLVAAAELFELAASITPPADRETAAERLVLAGIDRMVAGDPDRGLAHLRGHLDDLPPGPLRHRGLVYLALELAAHDMRAPIPVIERAMAESSDPRQRAEARRLLSSFHDLVGDRDAATAVIEANLAEARALDDELLRDELLRDALLSQASRRLVDDRSPWDVIEQWQLVVDRLQASPGRARLPWIPVHVPAFAHLRDGDFAAAQAALDAEPETSNIYHAGGHAAMLAHVAMAVGDAVAGEGHAEDQLAIGEQDGVPHLVFEGLTLRALARALMGAPARAEVDARRALDEAGRVAAPQATWEVHQALGFIALSRGDAPAASHEFESVPLHAWRRWNVVAGGRGTIDAIETAALLGDAARARELAAFLPDDAVEGSIAEGCVRYAEGDVDEAIRLVREAPTQPAPFREARRVLLLGRMLRRARRRGEARAALESARDGFLRIGATSWAAQGGEELGRLGGRVGAGPLLTESERQVGGLAAIGLSNKEIAARLGIAVRTVEAHLSKVYEKLAIESRASLAARWTSVSVPDDSVVDGPNIVDIRNRRRLAARPPLPSQSTGTGGNT